MAWHRQLSGASIARQTSSSALLAHDGTPSHNSSGANSRGSTSERIATPIRQETLESEEGFDPCPSSWYRQAKQTGGLGGAWTMWTVGAAAGLGLGRGGKSGAARRVARRLLHRQSQ